MLKKFASYLVRAVYLFTVTLFHRRLLAVDQSSSHYWLFDSNSLVAYWDRDQGVEDYETSLHRTGMAWSDNCQALPVLVSIPDDQLRIGP